MATTNIGWRERWYEIIFEADTRAGKVFDILLLIAIFLSVLTVILDSVPSIHRRHGDALGAAELIFTALFTIEYIARIVCVPRRWRYIFSFYGIVDLVAILPTYFIVVFGHGQQLVVIRSLRLLRIFRVLKLGHMLSEASALRTAIWASRSKVAVFLAFVVILVVIIGAAMHVIEDGNPGFASIPQSMYWAVVTMTTVGYGDVAPQSAFGKMLAAAIMILGYSMIIVPTGIVTAELTHPSGVVKPVTTQVCPGCMSEGHDTDATHCKYCGETL